MSDDDVVEIKVEIGHETKVGHRYNGALLAYDGENQFWIPKKIISIMDLDKDDIGTVTIPLQWAIDNGVI